MAREAERWFASIREKYADRMQCGRGCALCCHGLFDISLPDALEVAEALDRLPDEVRAAVTARAAEIHKLIEAQAPDLQPPYLLDAVPEETIDAIVDRAHSPRCPFLGQANECLIYNQRPTACRMEGVPMVDVQDGVFGDWCELNFRSGLSAQALQDLTRDYYAMQETDEAATAAAAKSLLGRPARQVTVFIPSVIVQFDRFWKPLLLKASAR